jgi:hypothetical protein
MQPRHYHVRRYKTVVNSLGACVLLGYGWFCWHNDIFYITPYWGYRSLHGISCKLMVGVLMCAAILLLLPVARAYLKPKQRVWCEKISWPIAYVMLGFFSAALLLGWIFTRPHD